MEEENAPSFFDNPQIQSALGAIMNHPKAQQILDKVSGFIDHAARMLNGTAEPVASSKPKEDPRIVLGFAPTAKLTVSEVKVRQRKLAELVHPDKGGSSEAMARINAAADALISSLK